MNNESRTLWVSLGAGIFAAFLLFSYSQEQKAKYDAQYGAMKNVIVAKRDISEMETIDDTMLEITQRPNDYLEPSHISEADIAVGQVAAVPIKKGEQILSTKLLHPGPDTGIALQVAPEKRAVTIPVDEVRSVAKLIRPGDRVDIFAAIEVGKGLSQRREVSLIMSDVVILATGINVMNSIPRTFEYDSSGKNIQQISLNGDTKYTTLTIEANPREAQDLIYLMTTSAGNIYFTLRNPNDRKAPPRMPSSNSESILGRTTISVETGSTIAPPTNVIRPSVPSVPQRR